MFWIGWKNISMPTTVFAVRRSLAIMAASLSRSSRGLSATRIRPLLSTEFGPPPPMVEFTYSTAGSLRMMSATLRWCSAIAANEMSVLASVMPST